MKVKLIVLISLFCFVQFAHGFTFEGPKWQPTRSYPYYINPANHDIPVITNVTGPLKAAANKWKTWVIPVYKGTSTIHTVSTTDGKNVVFFRSATSGAAIATTYYFYSGKTMLGFDMVWWDAAFKFFTTTSVCVTGFFLVDVGTHEFGHAIGMGHSTVLAATMYPGTVYCNTGLRTLATDDINGAKKLYP